MFRWLFRNPPTTPEPFYDCEITVYGIRDEDRRTLRAREEPKGVLVTEPFPWSMHVERVEAPVLVLYQAFFNGRKVDLELDPVGRVVRLNLARGDTLNLDLRPMIGDS